MNTERITLGDSVSPLLTDAWLDAVFAATREVRVRRGSQEGAGRKAMLLTGDDIAQLRWMLRLRSAVTGHVCDARWTIELHNTRSRVTTLHLYDSLLVRPDVAGATWRELRDGETLARWLDARGFRAPFDAWKHDRGCVRSPRGGGHT